MTFIFFSTKLSCQRKPASRKSFAKTWMPAFAGMTRQLLIFLLSAIWINAFAQTPSTFTLLSSSFENQTSLSKLYTCDGKDISPELHWTSLPNNTQSLALLVSDIDAPGGIFYHWIVYNIPPTVSSLNENLKQLPVGAIIGKNSWGKIAYNGPCPPKGSSHTYVFSLYALDSKLNLPVDAEGPAVIDALQSHLINKAELTVTYGRSSN